MKPLDAGLTPTRVLAWVHHLSDTVLPVFDKTVKQIPPERLDYRAGRSGLRLREIVYHVYHVLLAMTHTTVTGMYDPSAFPVRLNVAEVTHPDELLSYGKAVQRYVRSAVPTLTTVELDRAILNGPCRTGRACMQLAIGDVLHYIGQFRVYMQLLDIAMPARHLAQSSNLPTGNVRDGQHQGPRPW